MSRPLVLLACALSAGTACGAILRPSPNILYILAASLIPVVVLCVIGGGRFSFFKERCPPSFIPLLFAAIIAFAFGAGRASQTLRDAQAISVTVGGKAPILCEGEVAGEPRDKVWGLSFDLALSVCEGDEVHGAVRVNARYAPGDLASGDRVSVLMKVSPPRSFKNDGVFDYAGYLNSNGIAAVGSARGPVYRIARAEEGFIAGAMRRGRARVSASIDEALGPPRSAVVKALALGDRSSIQPEMRDRFARAGIAHLLALSGLHVGYVALCVYLILRMSLGLIPPLVSRWPTRMLAAAITIPAVWGYVIFTGGAISAVRAELMLTVYLAGVILMRRPDLPTTIAAAVIVILVASPLAVSSASFQLSLAAVIGIAAMALPLMRRFRIDLRGGGVGRRLLAWIAATAIVSFAAALFTAPIVAYHFKSVTAAGIFANVAAVPVAGFLLQPAVLAATFVAAISPAWALPLWHVAGVTSGLLIEIARAVTALGAPLVFRWAPGPAEVGLAFAAIALVLMWKRLPYRKALLSSLMLLMLTDVAYYRGLPIFGGRLSVTYLDVGQGESTLVRFPGGRSLLIDGGGIKGSSIDVGREVVAPALLAMGVRSIDWVLLTHPHFDHYAGLGHLVREFSPELVWVSGLDAPEKELEEWESFLAVASDAGVPLVVVEGDGVAMNVGGASLTIMPPVDTKAEDLNDTSLVARVSYGSRSFLFTGDLARVGEGLLVDSGRDLGSDVLKVGHHGSGDASTARFLDAVNPRIAVISAGQGNPYNFPHLETVARIESSGARLLRTDLSGAITISTDGADLDVRVFSEGG